jgi:poly(3-hydroxybutyrate) depolymerase
MKFLFSLFAFSACVAVSAALFGIKAKPALGKYNVDPTSITVSGISSGGAMAMQFHVIHSRNVSGAAIFAGGPFLCARPGLFTASICMLTPALVDVDRLIDGTMNLAYKGKIDDPAYLAGEKAWIFHGSEDIVVGPASGKKIQEFYEHFGTQVSTVFNIKANHGFPTENSGGPCGWVNPVFGFINNCKYDGAFESLNAMYGSLVKPTGAVGTKDNIVDFDQLEFDNILRTLDNSAYLYVPTACKSGAVQCKLHVAFHGCSSSTTYVGYGYLTKTGYMDVAEANNIIILFPQVNTLLNPVHCWDWMGYSSITNYANRDGPQIKAVYGMIDRIVNGA